MNWKEVPLSYLGDLVASVPFPPMYRIEQHFDRTRIADVASVVRDQLDETPELKGIADERVGVALGSRGIAGIDEVAQTVVAWARARGAKPFIVPAMGSHGGATPAGQRTVLAHLGITEETIGAPIRDSMAVRILEHIHGAAVYWSEEAFGADRLILVNRIKLHTAFRAARESGLTKMMVVGLGKREGAETLHGLGPERFPETIPAFASAIIRRAPPIIGLALVENAYHQICHVEALASAAFASREPELLELARRHMPGLPIDRLHVLVVDEIGKDISGDGMDPNVTGRFPVTHMTAGATIGKIVVLGLTEGTGGNGNGLGLADVTTEHVVDAVNWDMTYVNALSGMTTTTIKRPLAAESPAVAVKLAIKTSTIDPDTVQLVRIRNTLCLSTILASERLLETLARTGRTRVLEGPVDLWSHW